MVRGRVMGCPGRGLRLGRGRGPGVLGRLAGRGCVIRGWGRGGWVWAFAGAAVCGDGGADAAADAAGD